MYTKYDQFVSDLEQLLIKYNYQLFATVCANVAVVDKTTDKEVGGFYDLG